MTPRKPFIIQLPEKESTLPGREDPIMTPEIHYVLGTSIGPPFPENTEQAVFGLGCFWGAERAFWKLNGVISTAVGYAGGFTPNPTYQEVCSGMTGLGRRVDPSSVPSVSVFALSVTGKAQECSAQLVILYAGSAFL